MTYRDHQRVTDILAAIDAIHSHLARGDLPDGPTGSVAGRVYRVHHWGAIAAIPVFAWEVSLAATLILKGFTFSGSDEHDPSRSTLRPELADA